MRLRVMWVQDASPIGFIVSKKTIEILKRFYELEYFRLYDKDQMYAEYYEEDCNRPFIKQCEISLRCDREQLYMFYDIGGLEEIWEINELPFEYEMLRPGNHFSESIQYANGYMELGSITINKEKMRNKRTAPSRYFRFHKQLMGYVFYKGISILNKYELYTMGYNPEDLKKGIDGIEFIQK